MANNQLRGKVLVFNKEIFITVNMVNIFYMKVSHDEMMLCMFCLINLTDTEKNNMPEAVVYSCYYITHMSEHCTT